MSFELHFCYRDTWPEYLAAKIPGESEVRTYTPERTCHVETVPLGIHDDTTADVCSECRVPLDGDEYYCPNCGARVKEDADAII